MMFDGRNLSFSSSCRRRFSSRSRSLSSCADWRSLTACAIREAMMERNLASSWRVAASEAGLSALMAPTTSRPSLMGTQRKELSPLSCALRAPVLSRNSGSAEIRGTMAVLPVWITLPVMPSPSLYLPLLFCVAESPYAASIEISPV